MHNILFLESSLAPYRGGVQKVTYQLSTYLQKKGYEVYYAYYLCDYSLIPEKNKIKINLNGSYSIFKESFSSFLQENKIQIIINQDQYHPFLFKLYRLLKKDGVKLINCFHLSPDYFKYQEKTFLQKSKHFLYKMVYFDSLTIRQKRKMYEISDRFVLLSKSFINDFIQLYKIKDGLKICAISNPLMFNESLPYTNVLNKKKQILIVARFDEKQKNIKSALRIWKKIEGQWPEWKLVIVGYGKDEQIILNYSKFLSLKNVRFLGKCLNPLPLYEESAIFMMTSKYEGFGITLTESLQNACIPIAFDNFSVLHDIITDKYNGFIIPAFDEKNYSEVLLNLIRSSDMRHTMGINAIDSSKNFSLHKIGEEWDNLLKDVLSN